MVAYESAGDPPRNLTVFDGLQSVTQGKSALTIPVGGFQTPLSGPVRTRLGFVAYEGDRGLSGDSASLDGKTLTDAVNPANNFFNSTISVDGRDRTEKNPDYVNQLGFDANVVGVNGILANGATNANISLKTSSDQYLPQVVTFATDLYAPVIRATKTVTPGEPGAPDRRPAVGGRHAPLRGELRQSRAGGGAQLRGRGRALPADTTYLPGSLCWRSPAGPSRPTSGETSIWASSRAGSRAVRFCLEAGAAPGAGGTLADRRPGSGSTRRKSASKPAWTRM